MVLIRDVVKTHSGLFLPCPDWTRWVPPRHKAHHNSNAFSQRPTGAALTLWSVAAKFPHKNNVNVSNLGFPDFAEKCHLVTAQVRFSLTFRRMDSYVNALLMGIEFL